jgi:hypothetical protein
VTPSGCGALLSSSTATPVDERRRRRSPTWRFTAEIVAPSKEPEDSLILKYLDHDRLPAKRQGHRQRLHADPR